MLSIILLVRNTTESATRCIRSLLSSIAALGLAKEAVEYILIDDFSDASARVRELFAEARAAAAPSEVKIIHFKSHQHYTYGVAAGLSVARGEAVLFVSHDMMITPACIKTLMELAASDARIGVIRPVSPHMDCSRERQIVPPASLPLRDQRDVNAFASLIARYHGLTLQEPTLLIGDAMLITRGAIERIGVFDTRFFGFMGDIDYGVRARRSGLRVVTALGAWLYHEGSGTRKNTAATAGAEAENLLGRKLDEQVAVAWEQFRQKWDLTLPATFGEISRETMARLLTATPASTFDVREPPLAIDPAVWDVR
jgi:GT2 family glycosyltransferase